MATVKINCPTCNGEGLTGVATLSTCSQCKGVGTILVNDTQSLATISAASTVPVIVTAPSVSTVAVASAKIRKN